VFSAATAGLVEESAMMGRTRSELLSDVNQDTRPYRRQAHNGFEAYFSSDAAALVEHTRRCVSSTSSTLLLDLSSLLNGQLMSGTLPTPWQLSLGRSHWHKKTRCCTKCGLELWTHCAAGSSSWRTTMCCTW
jgi:hypothetical protein